MPSEFGDNTRACQIRLRIIATSDLHGRLWPYNYAGNTPKPGHGLATLANAIERLRTEAQNSLIFDNGDTLEGTPLSELAHKRDHTHPMIEAMNIIGYDAATPGNHDFNFGLDALQRAVDAAEFPYVLSNFERSSGAPFLARSLVLERQLKDMKGTPVSLRIGVIGLTPPQTLDWDEILLSGQLLAHPIVDAARRELTFLRDVEGVDLTIALCHSGIDPDPNADAGEYAAVPLAETGLVDLIIAGHSHQRFPTDGHVSNDRLDHKAGRVCGVPVVQPAALAREVGVIDLMIGQNTSGDWRVEASTSTLIDCSDEPPAQKILDQTFGAHQATLDILDEVLGHSDQVIAGYFDLIAGCSVLGLIAEAKRARATELLADSPYRDLPLLVAVGPMRSGGSEGKGKYADIAPGPMRMRHMFDLYSFANQFVILKIDGAGLKAWIEHAARSFHRIEPGKHGQVLINEAIAGYEFDAIDGVTYEIDVTAERQDLDPKGPGRLRNLRHDGRLVQDDDLFLMATSSFRAGGGGGYFVAQNAEPVLTPSQYVRDILIDHVRAQKTLSHDPLCSWKFADAGGTRILVHTDAGAARHAPTLAPFGIRFEQIAENGQAEFSMVI